MNNQQTQIIDYLNEKGKISSFNAMIKLGVCNLPARIRELKAQGYQIGDRTKKHKNRNGRYVHYKEYFLKGGAGNENIQTSGKIAP